MHASEYYKFYLTFFAAHGVLFENFTYQEDEARFTEEIFLPAFETVRQTFGVPPLIVPAVPEEESWNVYWWCYPKDVMDDIP